MMKRYLKPICIALVLLALLTSFAACGKEEAKTAQTLEESETVELQKTEEKKEETEETDVISIKTSPDKYTWYVKNYVGKNCASFGYTSLGEDRFDEYGEGLLKLIFITPDGSYVDYSTNKNLKEWVVTGQSLEPNTELKLTFERDSEGNEYSNLVDRQNYDEILLSVKKVGSSVTTSGTFTKINPSPDKYTCYVSDYVGRNLANCGYVSLGGNYLAEYGETTVKLVIVTEDGSYVDLEEEDSLRQYVVTAQSITPNTELKLTFDKDSDGNEYENLVESQNIDEIELYVKKLN